MRSFKIAMIKYRQVVKIKVDEIGGSCSRHAR
jgi:hypothetical protein